MRIEQGLRVTICDARVVDFGAATTGELFGYDHWKTLDRPIMGAEDFSCVLEKVRVR